MLMFTFIMEDSVMIGQYEFATAPADAATDSAINPWKVTVADGLTGVSVPCRFSAHELAAIFALAFGVGEDEVKGYDIPELYATAEEALRREKCRMRVVRFPN
jgi:hypothetical protein